MGFIRDWLDRRIAAEHEKLIQQCQEACQRVLTLMEAAYAVNRHQTLLDSVMSLNRLRTDLKKLEIELAVVGKLKPKDADTLLSELKKLGQAEREFYKTPSKP